MIKQKVILLVLIGVAAATAAFGAHRGLEKIEVHPASAPSDPAAVIAVLEAHPGISGATWDEKSATFLATVKDSVQIDLRGIRDEIRDAGIDPDSFVIEIAGARAAQIDYRPYLTSPANGFRYFMAKNMRQRYLWDFIPKNPWGVNVPLRVRAAMYWGAVDSAGVAAPDSVRILSFAVNDELAGPAPGRKRR